METPTANLLTIDVEDWFHILDAPRGAPIPEQWAALESRVEANTLRLLDLLEAGGSGATFFVLGWIAERFPRLIRAIHDRGFEVGSHGHDHVLVNQMTPDAFARDLRRSLDVISAATGQPVTSYRAAGFSITPDASWAFDILGEHGINVDASLFPGTHGHGGFPLSSCAPFLLKTSSGTELWEFPIAATRLFGRTVAFGGGGYLRLLPLPLVHRWIRQLNAEDIPATIYLHPREIDLQQPRMRELPWIRRFKYYVNLDTTEAKLESLLAAHRFQSLRDHLAEEGATEVLQGRALTLQTG
jgi:polysaccharide deacetylase family protein (PEP-CTERM system associated)